MSYRAQCRFWLDLDKPDEAELNDYISHCRQRRLWSQTVRDALRLIADLRSGNVTVLLEMFPHIGDKLADRAGGDDDMRAQLERLERALLGQNNGALMSSVGGPKPLSIAPVAGPFYDDDDDDAPLIVRTATPSGNSAQAFLDQCFEFVAQ